MTKKEVRKAAKGCGFKKLQDEVLDLVKMIRNFRKGENPADPNQRLMDIKVTIENLSEMFKISDTTFTSHVNPVDAVEAYSQKPEKSKKAKAA